MTIFPAFRLLLGIGLAVNGFAMLLTPAMWYDAIPGVAATGPLNLHFVRDIGCAYLIAAGSFFWLWRDPDKWPAAMTGTAFLLMHAGVHIAEILVGHAHLSHLVSDLPGVFLVPALALWLAWPRISNSDSRRTTMLRWIARRRLRAFERAVGYDASYLHHMLDASWTAFARFMPVSKMAQYREDIPLLTWHAAKIAATLSEDCGPCTQLGVRFGEMDGIPAATLKAIIEGDEHAMPPEALLGWRFARAVLAHSPEADRLRDEIVRRWGERAVISLALGIAAARAFPTVKYAMGHGKACTRIHVGNMSIRPMDLSMAKTVEPA
jgi:hypothetical protein